MTDEPILAACGLSVVLHRRKRLLDDISFAVQEGECLGLVGPNGAGKSTLMRVLAGLRRPGAGEVLLRGRPLRALGATERARQLALVEQQAETTDRLSVRQAVELGRTPYLSPLRPWSAEDDAMVARALRDVDMAQFADRLWHTLSGGERQRVHIARALAQTPALLLLDEPTNHLDIRHQLSILALIRRLPVTTVISLHDLNQAMACDRLLLMDGGRLLACGTPRDVLTGDNLRKVFGVETDFIADADGRPRMHFRMPRA